MQKTKKAKFVFLYLQTHSLEKMKILVCGNTLEEMYSNRFCFTFDCSSCNFEIDFYRVVYIITFISLYIFKRPKKIIFE